MWQMKSCYLTRPEPYDPGEFQGLARREYAHTEKGPGPVRGCCSFCPEPAQWMAFTETLKVRKPTAYALCNRHVRTKWWANK